MIHMALGEMDEAFESLEQSIEQRHLPTTFVNVEPMFQPLRSDTRYEALVDRPRGRRQMADTPLGVGVLPIDGLGVLGVGVDVAA